MADEINMDSEGIRGVDIVHRAAKHADMLRDGIDELTTGEATELLAALITDLAFVGMMLTDQRPSEFLAGIASRFQYYEDEHLKRDQAVDVKAYLSEFQKEN